MEEAEDFNSSAECGSDDTADGGVHSGGVSPAGDDGDFFQADSLFRPFGFKCFPVCSSAPLQGECVGYLTDGLPGCIVGTFSDPRFECIVVIEHLLGHSDVFSHRFSFGVGSEGF